MKFYRNSLTDHFRSCNSNFLLNCSKNFLPFYSDLLRMVSHFFFWYFSLNSSKNLSEKSSVKLSICIRNFFWDAFQRFHLFSFFWNLIIILISFRISSWHSCLKSFTDSIRNSYEDSLRDSHKNSFRNLVQGFN